MSSAAPGTRPPRARPTAGPRARAGVPASPSRPCRPWLALRAVLLGLVPEPDHSPRNPDRRWCRLSRCTISTLNAMPSAGGGPLGSPVARHWRPAQVTGPSWLDALRAELKAAAAEGRPVAVGAARHSMGGQALVRDGVAMTLDVRGEGRETWLEANPGAGTYRVAAGA